MRYMTLTSIAATMMLAAAPVALAQTQTTPGVQRPSTSPQTGGTAYGTQSGATTTQNARMSEDSVRSMLRAQGYSDISDVRRDGDFFKAQAKQNGKLQKLEIDARSGMVMDSETKRLTESSVRERIKDKGYSDVSDLKRDGEKYEAKAKKDGKNVNLDIDAKSGSIDEKDG